MSAGTRRNPTGEPSLAADYVFEPEHGVWIRRGFRSLPYSDGDEIERKISDILSACKDLSSASDELQAQCDDWVTSYHLSKQRANLLRPFERHLSGSVLEIGAGCGAITRYLAEVAQSVVFCCGLQLVRTCCARVPSSQSSAIVIT